MRGKTQSLAELCTKWHCQRIMSRNEIEVEHSASRFH